MSQSLDQDQHHGYVTLLYEFLFKFEKRNRVTRKKVLFYSLCTCVNFMHNCTNVTVDFC